METATTPLPEPARRALATLAALLAALLLLASAAATAGAGTYTVWSCRGPDGAALPAAAWHPAAGATEDCATGGALTAAIDGEGTAGAVLLAPPGTSITGYRANLTARTGDGWLHDSGVQAGLGEGGPLGTPAVTAGCTGGDCVFGDEQDLLGAAGAVDVTLRQSAGALALVASCDGHWLLGCGFGDHGSTEAVARLWRSAVDLSDEEPPAIGEPAGSLLAGPASGRATLAAPVSDAGGGVAQVELLVDGAPAGTVRAGGACAEPYVLTAPCPASLPVSFEVDAAALAPGAHTAELRATDAAGGTSERGPIAFTVAEPPPPPAPAAPAGVVVVERLPAPAPLAATVSVERRRVAPGGTVRGSVSLDGGGRAAGARLVVAARRFGPGDPPERIVASATTAADGTFAVPAGRTPRTLVVRLDDAAYRAARSPSVRVAGPLRITAERRPARLRNGGLLTVRARILGAGPGAAADRTVLVQARVGRRWATVDSVEARADGSATWRYRFQRTTRPAVYRFRLRIPAGGEDWPWPVTHSPVVSVAVRP